MFRRMEAHPNLLRFYGVIEKPLCIVTEFCENGSLSHRLESDVPLSMRLMVKIMHQIALGMRHLGAQNIGILLMRLNFSSSRFGCSKLSFEGGLYCCRF